MENPTTTLNNGTIVPKKAYGFWNVMPENNIEELIIEAIKIGYRHFDFALIYENEKEIGIALENIFKSGLIKREELFIASKLWNTYHDHVNEGIEQSIKDLKLEYLDLYMIHWPVHAKPDSKMRSIYENGKVILNEFDIKKLWPRMENLVKKGLVKSIGVSNFGIENITKVLNICTIKPVVNQIELHPFLQQKDLVSFCKKNGIILEAYSTLRSLKDIKNNILGNEIKNIAKNKNCSISNVIINFLLQNDFVSITKTVTKERISENFKTLELSEQEMEIIRNIKETKRYIELPEFGEDRFK